MPYTEEGAGDVLQLPRTQSAGGVLMEFLPGFTLKDPQVQGLLAPDAPSAPALLRSLGSMIGLDMLINNFDRSPYVWSHNGNANNLIFHKDAASGTPELCAIDQGVSPILDADGCETYLGQVREALAEARVGSATGPHIAKVRTYLETFGGVVLDDKAAATIQEGVVHTAREIADFQGLQEFWQVGLRGGVTSLVLLRLLIGGGNLGHLMLSFPRLQATLREYEAAGKSTEHIVHVNMDFLEAVRGAMAEALKA